MELLVGLYADQREVGLRVAAYHRSGQLNAVDEANRDAVHVLDDVIVRDDVAVLRDHEAAPETRHHALARLLPPAEGLAPEGEGEELLDRVAHHRLLGADVHDARRGALGQIREGTRHAQGHDGRLVRTLLPEGTGGYGGRLLLVVASAAEQVDRLRRAVRPADPHVESAGRDQRDQRHSCEHERLAESPHSILPSLHRATPCASRCGRAPRRLIPYSRAVGCRPRASRSPLRWIERPAGFAARV